MLNKAAKADHTGAKNQTPRLIDGRITMQSPASQLMK
jgi:hypothetical protein